MGIQLGAALGGGGGGGGDEGVDGKGRGGGELLFNDFKYISLGCSP